MSQFSKKAKSRFCKKAKSRFRPNFDHFDLLPDPILLIIFEKVADVKDLCRCSTVSRRFHSLVPSVDNLLVRLDSDSDSDSSRQHLRFSFNLDSIIELFDVLVDRYFKHRISSLFGGKIPTHFLKSFSNIRFLKIELPKGEFEIEDGILLKWRADFGSQLHNCMLLVASSMTQSNSLHSSANDNNGVTPNSNNFSLILSIFTHVAAMSQHYLLQTVITENKSLDRLTLSDVNGQGVLTMNREQLEECRATPFSIPFPSRLMSNFKSTAWYAPQLDLPDGTVLKDATLVAFRLRESKKEVCDASFLSDAFEEPFGTAAKMLIKSTISRENTF